VAAETGRRAQPILARVFAALGLAMLIVAGVAATARATDLAGAEHADGTVFALTGGAKGFAPVVQFTPTIGGTVPFTADVDSNPPAYQVGDHVRVLYPPDKPRDAVIDSFWQIWFSAAVFALSGVTFIVVGIALATADLATRRSLSWRTR
jgi:hypothetical protein